MNAPFLSKEKILTGLLVASGALLTAGATITGSKLLLIPFILLGGLCWIHLATKRPAIALIIIVFFAEDCFKITSFGIRQRLLSDLSIALMLSLIILNMQRVWNHISKDRSAYTIAILLFFSALIVSLYVGSYITFGQPMSVGLIVARKHLLFLSYFFFVAINATREDCFLFLKYLAWLGGAIAFLSIIEVILGGGVIFSNYYAVGQERAGMLRIHVGTFLIVFSVIYSFIRQHHLPKASKKRLFYLGLTLMGLLTLGAVVMTRAVILGLAVTFTIWLIRRISHRRIMFLCATISFVVILILSGIGNRILSETFIGGIVDRTTTELGAETGNISIRQDGVKFFVELLFDKAPFTGIGLFSDTNFPNNPITLAAKRNHYFIVDSNGISTLIYFGFQGLLLLTFFVIKSLIDSRHLMIDQEKQGAFNFEVLFFLFIYILCTPTLNNIIVERMLVYSGAFFYLLSLTKDPKTKQQEEQLQ